VGHLKRIWKDAVSVSGAVRVIYHDLSHYEVLEVTPQLKPVLFRLFGFCATEMER
jgi:hypothetical protein